MSEKPKHKKNKKKDQKRQKRKARKITPTYLHNAGLYYLERFSASTGQFKEVMTRKIKKSCMEHPEQSFEESQAMLDDIITRFQENGLLNDELYTRGVVNSLRRMGKSQKAIYAKLKSKYVCPILIQDTLNAYDEEHEISSNEADFKAALTFARKKRLGPFKNPVREIPNEKALGSLARAGFSYTIAQQILEMDPEEALELERS